MVIPVNYISSNKRLLKEV